jgi:hypothetical protein
MHLTLVETSITPVSFSEIDILIVRELRKNPLAARVVSYDYQAYARDEESAVSSPLARLTGRTRSSLIVSLNNPIQAVDVCGASFNRRDVLASRRTDRARGLRWDGTGEQKNA